ncbi:MAG: YbhN family protein [bacterium]
MTKTVASAAAAAPPPAASWQPTAGVRRHLRRFTPLLVMALLAAAALLLHHELRNYHYAEVRRALLAISWRTRLTALGLTALSYAMLTGYDALALRYLQRPLPYRRTALASFLGYVFAHNIGLSVFGGAAPRYRLYSAWGLAPGEIALLIGFTGVTFWLGICTVVGMALVLDAHALAPVVHVSPDVAHALGGGLLALAAAYVLLTVWRRQPLQVREWTIPLPRPPIALAQLVVSAADWVVAAAVLSCWRRSLRSSISERR